MTFLKFRTYSFNQIHQRQKLVTILGMNGFSSSLYYYQKIKESRGQENFILEKCHKKQ